MRFILSFVYHYPLFMAFVWMLGAMLYRMRRVSRDVDGPVPILDSYPSVSFLIPCHNEEDCIEETIRNMALMDYPDYEIIAIDDGSTDGTRRKLEELSRRYDKLRVAVLETNQGKARALKVGLILSRSEFLIGVDADAFLSPDALRWMMWHFVNSPRVGAVTGNPRIRNRTSLLGKIQVGEYSTIIGMIKRAQRMLGKVFTVSGVVVAFRKKALLDSGLWSDDMATEDIDITWKLETHFWDVRFEERALCWILTPESLGGLWKQRVRWAQGGAEVILKYAHVLRSSRQLRLWPVYLEYVVSVAWTYAFFLVVLVATLNLFCTLPAPYSLATIVPPRWAGTFLAGVCTMQAGIALLFDRHVEKGLFKYLFWFIWYPVVYWLLSASATVVGLPRAIIRRKGQRAVWDSPDRGLAGNE